MHHQLEFLIQTILKRYMAYLLSLLRRDIMHAKFISRAQSLQSLLLWLVTVLTAFCVLILGCWGHFFFTFNSCKFSTKPREKGTPSLPTYVDEIFKDILCL